MFENTLYIVISGPSGVGKTAMCKRLKSIIQTIETTVSVTTRSPRDGEREGIDYYYCSSEHFARLISQEAFVEWTQTGDGAYYGTLWSEIKKYANREIVLCDMDTKGGLALKNKLGTNVVLVLLLPNHAAVLYDHLKHRGTETEQQIISRLTNAEIQARDGLQYDYVIINDNIEKSARQLTTIVEAEQLKADKQRQHIATISEELTAFLQIKIGQIQGN